MGLANERRRGRQGGIEALKLELLMGRKRWANGKRTLVLLFLIQMLLREGGRVGGGARLFNTPGMNREIREGVNKADRRVNMAMADGN